VNIQTQPTGQTCTINGGSTVYYHNLCNYNMPSRYSPHLLCIQCGSAKYYIKKYTMCKSCTQRKMICCEKVGTFCTCKKCKSNWHGVCIRQEFGSSAEFVRAKEIQCCPKCAVSEILNLPHNADDLRALSPYIKKSTRGKLPARQGPYVLAMRDAVQDFAKKIAPRDVQTLLEEAGYLEIDKKKSPIVKNLIAMANRSMSEEYKQDPKIKKLLFDHAIFPLLKEFTQTEIIGMLNVQCTKQNLTKISKAKKRFLTGSDRPEIKATRKILADNKIVQVLKFLDHEQVTRLVPGTKIVLGAKKMVTIPKKLLKIPINQLYKYYEDQFEDPVSIRTVYNIVNTVTSGTIKAKTCVADNEHTYGTMNFIALKQFISEEKLLNDDDTQIMHKIIDKIHLEIQTSYLAALNTTNESAWLNLKYLLSDPEKEYFQEVSNPVYSQVRLELSVPELMENLFIFVEDKITQDDQEKTDSRMTVLNIFRARFKKYMIGMVTHKWQKKKLKKAVGDLNEHDVMIIMDFMMKFESYYPEETQTQFFGKRGSLNLGFTISVKTNADEQASSAGDSI